MDWELFVGVVTAVGIGIALMMARPRRRKGDFRFRVLPAHRK